MLFVTVPKLQVSPVLAKYEAQTERPTGIWPFGVGFRLRTLFWSIVLWFPEAISIPQSPESSTKLLVKLPLFVVESAMMAQPCELCPPFTKLPSAEKVLVFPKLIPSCTAPAYRYFEVFALETV